MELTFERIRGYRLQAHNLAAPLPTDRLAAAAGVCGLQNTPPGAWETALWARLKGCSLSALEAALYQEKTLLQAWSIRGVPLVFPAAESDVFLSPLIAQAGEQPWVYTLGISGVLEHMQMPFDNLLARTKKAALYLDTHTIKSKEALDSTLADIVCDGLPKEKQALWRTPSIYGNPEKQTMGGAAVSFLLRPCSFYSLVVFGRRDGASPTFTSYKNWIDREPVAVPKADKELVRKFLRAYGPATADYFMAWLGCSKKQARRLWGGIADEMEPVMAGGKTHYILTEQRDALLHTEADEDRLLLLGPHDPYLDLRDRAVILEDRARQKTVWQYVSNPGAVLKGGRVIGVWRQKTLKGKLELSIELWAAATPAEEKTLKNHAEQYAAFRGLGLRRFAIA